MTDTITDRDAAPAAAEGVDYWGYWGVYLPESRIPDEPVALFRYSDHADRWARASYPGRHELRANKAARPAPAAAPREDIPDWERLGDAMRGGPQPNDPHCGCGCHGYTGPNIPYICQHCDGCAAAREAARGGYDTPGAGHEGDLWSIPEMAGLAEEVHAAWRDGMDNQGREVASERRQWETLDPLDHGLDRYIAQRLLLFIRSAGLDGYAVRAAAREAARGEGDTNGP